MSSFLGEQRKHINRFFLAARHTISDLYRADSYVTQLEYSIKKLTGLLELYDQKSVTGREVPTKEYVQLLNSIASEMQYLKALSSSMDDNIKEIEDSEIIQHKMSQKSVRLKNKMDDLIKKADRIITKEIVSR